MSDHERTMRESAAVPCTLCAAPVGEHCRTDKGRPAVWPHAVRSSLARMQDLAKTRAAELDALKEAVDDARRFAAGVEAQNAAALSILGEVDTEPRASMGAIIARARSALGGESP